jgi:hypothetical protein
MSELSFTQLSNQFQEHFANSTFTDGLSLASKQMIRFSKRTSDNLSKHTLISKTNNLMTLKLYFKNL